MNLDKPLLFLGCSDLEETRVFYETILGLKYLGTEFEILTFEVGSTKLRISKQTDFQPQLFTQLGWLVEDIENVIDDLVAKGVEFIRYPQFNQDERGIWNPGVAKIAYFLDPSGNNLSLTQYIS